jgi:hypothetical protein
MQLRRRPNDYHSRKAFRGNSIFDGYGKLCLVDAILTDLDKPDPELDRIWAEESRNRWAAYKSGHIPSVSCHEVMDKYRRS